MSEEKASARTMAILFLAWIAFMFLATGGLHDPFHWHEPWRKWDADWYEKIFQDGYAKEPRSLVFPPGFPWIVGFVSAASGFSFSLTAMIVNLAAYFGAGLLLTRIARVRFGVSEFPLFLFFLSAPTAYFAFAPYTDSIFIFFMWLGVSLALRDQKTLSVREKLSAWLILAFLPLLRLTGYALFSWVILKRWFALAVLLALGIWLGLNQLITHNPLYFLEAQKLFDMPQGNFIDGLVYTAGNFIPEAGRGFGDNFNFWLQFHFLPLVLLIGLTATAVWLVVRKEWLLALTLITVLFISHNQSFWRSAVRYDLPLIPLIALPLLAWAKSRHKALRFASWTALILLTLINFALQVFFAGLFRSGQWAF